MFRRLTAFALVIALPAVIAVVGLGITRHAPARLRTTLPTTYEGTGPGVVGPFEPGGPWAASTIETVPGPGGFTLKDHLSVLIIGPNEPSPWIGFGDAPSTDDAGQYTLDVMASPEVHWTIRLRPAVPTTPETAYDGPTSDRGGWWVPLVALGAGLAMLYASHPIGLRRRRPLTSSSQVKVVGTLPLESPRIPQSPARIRRRRHISWARALGDQAAGRPR